MPSDSQQTLGFDPATGQPLPPRSNLIAPLWHTVLIVVLILGNSFAGLLAKPSSAVARSRIVVYSTTFVFELILILLIWVWIRRSGVSMRDLIGGRWQTVESFLIDVALAIGFLIVADVSLAVVRIALGTLDLHHMDKQLAETKRVLAPLIPHSPLEAGMFVALSVGAGFFEEIIFRGYLQRQFAAIARNAYAGIAIAAVFFGLGHAYQGGRMMIALAVYGAFFGVLAHVRKSLRPGIIAHATQDAYSGLALFFLSR